MDVVDDVLGPRWLELRPGAHPVVPAGVPRLEAHEAGRPLRWWVAYSDAGDHELYGALGGDMGAEGPYVGIVYAVPAEMASAGAKPRSPTFEELHSFVRAVTVEGVVFAVQFPNMGEPVGDVDGWKGLAFSANLVLDGTPAARRMALAAKPGAMLEVLRG